MLNLFAISYKLQFTIRCKEFNNNNVTTQCECFLGVLGGSRFITNIGLSVGIPTSTDLSGILTDKINETQLIKLMFKKEYVFIWQKGTPGRSTFVKPTLQNEWLRKYWQTGRVGVDWLASCEPDEHTEIFIMSFIFRYYPTLKFTIKRSPLMSNKNIVPINRYLLEIWNILNFMHYGRM